MARFRKNPRKDAGHRLQSLWKWPARRLGTAWRHWGLDVRIPSFVEGLSKFNYRLLQFRGTEYTVLEADGAEGVREWPSKGTLLNPLWWLFWSAQFFWRWLRTRRLRPLLLAVPSLVALSLFLVVYTSGLRVSPGMESLRYKAALARAVNQEDFATALLCCKVLLRANPDSPKLRYDQALVYSLSGDQDRAEDMMTELAKNDRSCNAALWLANQVGDLASYGTWTPLQKQQYYHWLTLANHNDPSALLPKKILVEVLRKSGDTQQAYQLLHSAADEDQEAAYMMAVLADEVGRREEAARRAQMLVRKYQDTIQRNPEDHESRLRWASLLVLAGDERKAIDALQEGLRLAADEKQRKQLRSAMVEAIVVSSKKLQQQDDSPTALLVSLRMLKEAMRIDATNVNLLEAISDACVKATDSNDNQLEILRESLVQGVDPDTAHFILGTAALNQGKIQEATQHLEISIRNNPGLPGLLNNMACLIMSEESPDLERALRLSEAALRSQPNHTYLRETRGQILFRMQRYTEAIADLEFALSSPELRKSIRLTLAKAYDALGQTEIAERQRELMSQRR